MRALPLLVVFLALLLGGGVYNYQRNAHLDQDLEFRPYAGISDGDLEALIEAHQTRFQQMASSFTSDGPEVDLSRVDPSNFGGKLTAFERFQRENERWKQGRRDMLQEQVMVEALRREQQVRAAGLDKAWVRILRRTTAL